MLFGLPEDAFFLVKVVGGNGHPHHPAHHSTSSDLCNRALCCHVLVSLSLAHIPALTKNLLWSELKFNTGSMSYTTVMCWKCCDTGSTHSLKRTIILWERHSESNFVLIFESKNDAQFLKVLINSPRLTLSPSCWLNVISSHPSSELISCTAIRRK